MPPKKLTEKQELIFEFIRETIRDSGFPPTVREIGDKFNITVRKRQYLENMLNISGLSDYAYNPFK